MNLLGLSLLGHSRASAVGNGTPPINPATAAELTPCYFWATPDDVSKAAQFAHSAFLQFRRWPAKRRSELLRRVAQLLETNAPQLMERGSQETALPNARLHSEIGRTCGQLRLFASLIEEGWWLDARIDHADLNRKPLPKPDVRSMLQPLGPVAVFSSSNFPFAFSVAGGDTASALAAGCPVIVKPHQGHLGTSEMVGQLIQQAAQDCSAPHGVFSMLFGPGREVGMALVKHPLIKAVGFTGSRAGGRALMDAAASRLEPIPVYAEMGSINPVFLLPGALQQNADSIATGLHASVTLGVGQFCTNPGLVFVQPGAQQFVGKLSSLMSATAPGVMLTPSIWSEYCAGVQKFSRFPGVRLLTNTSPQSDRAGSAHAAMFATDAETFVDNRTLMDEVFGPSTLVVQCDSKSQVLAAAEKLEGQLTATIHGTPDDLAANRDLIELLENKVGRLVFNGFPTGVEVCHAMHHGGPYPATSDGRSTSVGTRAIQRFTRPVCYQNFPDPALPDELKDANPRHLWRLVDGKFAQ